MKYKKELYKIVEDACKSPNNPHGAEAFPNHILKVVYYGKKLAKELGADCNVVELACLFHDYASVLDKKYVDDHHIYGAQFTGDILLKYNFKTDFIDRVKKCILHHRSSKPIKKGSVEEGIVASADAMAHIINVKSVLFYAYTRKNFNMNEGADWVLKKISRSYKKIMPEAKEYIDQEYKLLVKLLSA